MRPATSLALLPLLLTAGAQAPPSLFEALTQAGASNFAKAIQADPVLSATYSSPSVGTVFAPGDLAAVPPVTKKGKRDTTAQQKINLSAGQGINNFATLGKPPGAIVPTSDTDANLLGKAQSVVTDSRNTSSGSQKRWVNAHRRAGGTQSSLLTITSGLGAVVNIVKADIPYSGGVIHLTDNYFTLPQPVSATTQSLGLNVFSELAGSANLTSSLDNTPLTTLFVPCDAAFAAANLTTPSADTASLLAGHILPNFLGYLPALVNGATLPTQGGKTLTVTVKGSDYFINNAKITQANIILPNGVAHVIDKVIEFGTPPATSSTPVVTSGTPVVTSSVPVVTSSSVPFVYNMNIAGAITMVCAVMTSFFVGLV